MIPHYIDFLEKYLGADNVTHRLQQINREIQMESGAYLHYWLLPNSSFWLGLQEARQQLPTITDSLEKTLEIAAKLQTLYYSMSSRVRNDLRTRILNADDLSPIFFEIDTAAHFWQLGYEIEWAEPLDKPGLRIPEFTLINGSNKVEVECKSKRADSGRKIHRPDFYKLVDEVAASLSSSGYIGKVNIVVPDRMPIHNTWKKQVATAIDQLLISTVLHTQFNDGTEITIDLHKLGEIVIPAEKVVVEARKNIHPYSYLAIIAKVYGNWLTNPLIFELKSKSDDRSIKNIFDNLKDANHQFTGENASMICCFVPEVDSFAGLQQDSALFRMTAKFFKNHAKPYVFAVSYSSNFFRTITPFGISKSSPSISIENPFYDEKFGPRIRMFQ